MPELYSFYSCLRKHTHKEYIRLLRSFERFLVFDKNVLLLELRSALQVSFHTPSRYAITVTTPMLSPDFRDRLVKMLKRNKGNVPLTMFLYDPQKKWNIEFLSHKFKVQVTLPFIEELKSLGIRYSVTKK